MTEPIKAMIVDDSRLARNELKHLLAEHKHIQIAHEADSGQSALDLLSEHDVDVLFLDIQMPGMDGFELLQRLDRVPQVIFVTAFDQYAIQAFEHNALDYLQKPIEPSELARAIERIDAQQNSTQMLSAGDRVFVKDGDACWFVPIDQIRLLTVDGNYTTLHFDTHSPMIPKTLNHLATRLDPELFFRANRNAMINLKHIEGVEPWVQGIRVTLSGGEQVELSRRQTQQFKALMSL